MLPEYFDRVARAFFTEVETKDLRAAGEELTGMSR